MSRSTAERSSSRKPSGPITPERMSQPWGIDPDAEITSTTGLSAALWRFSTNAAFECTLPADPTTNVVNFILGGRMHTDYSVNGRRRWAKVNRPRHFRVVAAGEEPQSVVTDADGARFMHVYVPQALIRQCAEELVGRDAERRVELVDPAVSFDPQIDALVSLILSEIRHDAPSRLLVDGVGVALATNLVRRWSNLAAKPLATATRGVLSRHGLAAWQVNRVRDLMVADLAQDVGLARLAFEVRLSTYHFARAFRRATGSPPHQFLVALRVKRVCELLETTGLPITKISALVGYDDPGNLARVFKRALGCTPSAYRRERRW